MQLEEPDRVVATAKTPMAIDAELETGMLERLDTRGELDELS